MHIATKAQGIDNLFDVFFGFLHRKTDYYNSVDEKTSRDKVINSYEKWAKLNKKSMQEKEDARLRKEQYEAEKKKKEEESQASGLVEVTDEEAARIEAEEKLKKSKI